MNFFRHVHQRLAYKGALKKRRLRIKAESLAVIDQMVVSLGKKLPYLQSYRTELVPLIYRTGRYLDTMLDAIPGPAALDPNHWDKDPLIHSMFVSEKHTKELIADSEPLQRFFQGSNSKIAFALLTAEKREKTISGTEFVGEIVRRDVIQKAIFFEQLQITMPTDELAKTRRQVKYQLFSDLFTQAAEKISEIKAIKSELKTRHDVITAKMPLFINKEGQKEMDELHDALEKQIEEIGATLDSPDDYISPLKNLLLNPQIHISAKPVVLKLNSMGILLSDNSKQEVKPILLAEFESNAGKKCVATWIRVEKENVTQQF